MGNKKNITWYYASVGGHSGSPKVCTVWTEMEAEVKGANATHQKFKTKAAALAFIEQASKAPGARAEPARRLSCGACYAVSGPHGGVYKTWGEAAPNVKGVRAAQVQRCKSAKEAEEWLNSGCEADMKALSLSSTTKTETGAPVKVKVEGMVSTYAATQPTLHIPAASAKKTIEASMTCKVEA